LPPVSTSESTDRTDRAASPLGWDHRRAGWLVVAISVLVFAPTLALGRVAFDDEWLWSDDSPLRTPSIAMLAHVWFELDAHARRDLGSEYLPVRDLVVAADMAIWGSNERGLHATQLVLYALTVFGLGGLLVRFGARRDLAWLATLLWAIHPIHVESVAWLSERKGVLAGVFVVACGHAWIRYRRGGPARYLVLGAIAAIAGTWSKAPAMFAPAVFVAWDLLLLPAARRRWIAFGVIGGATAVAAIPVVLLARDAGVVDSRFEAAPDGRLISALGAQGHYLESLVLVRRPSVSYPIQSDGAAALDLALGAVAVLGSLALAVVPRRGRAWRLALLAWAWIWFFPISHLAATVHIAVADRFAYLWCLAGCAGGAWLVLRLRGPARLAVTGVLICVLGITTLRAQAAWTSSIDLFANAFAESPTDPVAAERLVQELFSAGQHVEALAVIDRGLAVHPEHAYLLARKARMLDAIGRRSEALATAERAARSGHASTMSLYAEQLAHAGRPSEALGFAERAAQRRPENPDYARRRIEILIALARFGEAVPLARELCVRDRRAVSHIVLGRALVGGGEIAEARRELDLAVAMDARDDMLAPLRAAIERASR
jgi:tetratricopeptide (TPR) repeat protein